MKKTLLAGAAALSLMTGAAYADVTVATAGPMTGQYASFGEQMKAGAEMAIEDINAAGGINGEQVQLEIGDDACDPKQAVAVANQLVGEDVVFVAGHFCSGSSIPASSVYAEEGIIQMSPASTNPKFTDERPGPQIFRIVGRDDQQGAVAGQYLADQFGDKTIAIINDKTAYGKGLADETQKAMEAAGKNPDLVESYTAGEKDYTALISKLKQQGVDVVYIGGYHTEAGLMARQARDQGLDLQFVSGDALVTDEYWSIAGDAGEGTLMTFSPDPRNIETNKDLVQRFRDKGVEPEGYTLYTYAALQAFKQAAEKAGSTDPEAVMGALNEGEYDTVLGTVSFDDKGDVSLPGYVFYRWQDGQYAQIPDGSMGSTATSSDASASEESMDESMEKTEEMPSEETTSN